MSYTSADLAALDAAIKNAELEVEIDGERVRYRSTDDLLKARKHVAEQIALAGGSGTRRGSVYRFTFSTLRGD